MIREQTTIRSCPHPCPSPPNETGFMRLKSTAESSKENDMVGSEEARPRENHPHPDCFRWNIAIFLIIIRPCMSMLVFVGFGPFRSFLFAGSFRGCLLLHVEQESAALFVWRATIRYQRGNLGREVRNSLRLKISQMQVPTPQAKKSQLPVAIPVLLA